MASIETSFGGIFKQKQEVKAQMNAEGGVVSPEAEVPEGALGGFELPEVTPVASEAAGGQIDAPGVVEEVPEANQEPTAVTPREEMQEAVELGETPAEAEQAMTESETVGMNEGAVDEMGTVRGRVFDQLRGTNPDGAYARQEGGAEIPVPPVMEPEVTDNLDAVEGLMPEAAKIPETQAVTDEKNIEADEGLAVKIGQEGAREAEALEVETATPEGELAVPEESETAQQEPEIPVEFVPNPGEKAPEQPPAEMDQANEQLYNLVEEEKTQAVEMEESEKLPLGGEKLLVAQEKAEKSRKILDLANKYELTIKELMDTMREAA